MPAVGRLLGDDADDGGLDPAQAGAGAVAHLHRLGRAELHDAARRARSASPRGTPRLGSAPSLTATWSSAPGAGRRPLSTVTGSEPTLVMSTPTTVSTNVSGWRPSGAAGAPGRRARGGDDHHAGHDERGRPRARPAGPGCGPGRRRRGCGAAAPVAWSRPTCSGSGAGRRHLDAGQRPALGQLVEHARLGGRGDREQGGEEGGGEQHGQDGEHGAPRSPAQALGGEGDRRPPGHPRPPVHRRRPRGERPRHQVQVAGRPGGEAVVVGDDHERAAPLGGQRFEQAHDPRRAVVVEVARGLVGQHEAGLVDQRPGDRHPLALAAAEGRGAVLGPVAQARRRRAGPPPAAGARCGLRPARMPASSTFSAAVSVSSRPKCWKTKPTVSRR